MIRTTVKVNYAIGLKKRMSKPCVLGYESTVSISIRYIPEIQTSKSSTYHVIQAIT